MDARRVVASITLAAGIATLGFVAGAAESKQPATPQKSKITTLGKGTLTVAAKRGQDKATAYVSVLNAGSTPVRLSVTFQAASATGVTVAAFTPKDAAPGATRLRVTFAGLATLQRKPVAGQLVVEGGAAPVARAVSITPAPHPSRDWATWILGKAVMAFVVLFVVGVLVGLRKWRIFAPAAGPKWSLDSWASTLTTAGGILGTVLGAATLPEIPREIDKDTLVRLNLLFGVLVLVGPFLFQAIRNPFVKPTDQDAAYTGWNLTLLLACAITGAAVAGELATLGLLGWELAGPGDWGTAAVVGVVVLAVAAAYYFLVTVIQLVTTDWKGIAKQDAQKAADDAAKPQHYVVSVREVVNKEVKHRRLTLTVSRTAEIAPVEQQEGELGEVAAAPGIEVVEPAAVGPARRWKLP